MGEGLESCKDGESSCWYGSQIQITSFNSIYSITRTDQSLRSMWQSQSNGALPPAKVAYKATGALCLDTVPRRCAAHSATRSPSTHRAAALSIGELLEGLELCDPFVSCDNVILLNRVCQGRAALEPSTGSPLVDRRPVSALP